jgi:hypothetical protein
MVDKPKYTALIAVSSQCLNNLRKKDLCNEQAAVGTVITGWEAMRHCYMNTDIVYVDIYNEKNYKRIFGKAS